MLVSRNPSNSFDSSTNPRILASPHTTFLIIFFFDFGQHFLVFNFNQQWWLSGPRRYPKFKERHTKGSRFESRWGLHTCHFWKYLVMDCVMELWFFQVSREIGHETLWACLDKQLGLIYSQLFRCLQLGGLVTLRYKK